MSKLVLSCVFLILFSLQEIRKSLMFGRCLKLFFSRLTGKCTVCHCLSGFRVLLLLDLLPSINYIQ